MADAKKAKYFCEGCGSEVVPDAKFCPKCGRFFAAVRCPNCGHIGTVRNFIKGCPACHYAMSKDEIYGEPSSQGRKKRLSASSRKKIKKAFKNHQPASLFSDDVPAWLFFASIIALIVIFAVLFIRCKN
ncbi:zinc ribbon domain-containing protein [Treponema sp.]|uniref:zinc ribbon domain-containing protein n=1 Tax=Treponema sp. TaxID=166 RepID=UPI003EFE773C